MSTTEQLLAEYEGKIVPRGFHFGFIIVSYVVSLIGTTATLELINRRTSPKGKYNHMLLVSAAVSMGGIAIWSMHFIGNRALNLADGQSELQISYSSGFTALSFFVPILVLLAAFWATGTNNSVSWWRVGAGGILAGLAICGMHYLGNASIENYQCVYNIGNVVGAAVIASAASVVALSLFFVFRAAWTNSWWKRILCAVVMAGAVSGMHWCASIGTQYKLLRLNTDTSHLSRDTTVIIVILLSFSACVIMAGTAVYGARIKRRYATKAQQIILATAVFDKQGRILVNSDGLIPSEVITDSYLEKTHGDMFSVAHPLFHWMFQASRSWSGISNVLGGMVNHLSHLPRDGSNARTGIRLINEHGELIENYDLVFRELFCFAASSLADKLKEHLSQVGILWDEILATGSDMQCRQDEINKILPKDGSHADDLSATAESMAEKGISRRKEVFTRGSLMFLVRRVDSRHVDRLQSVGYRFADIRQVSPIIRSRMQIRGPRLEEKFANMATYADENTMLEQTVHLGFFGVRARVGSFGFDVLVRKGARNLLPAVPLPFKTLEPSQREVIRQLDGTPASVLPKKLDLIKQAGGRDGRFASALIDGIDHLAAWLSDPIFDEATLTAQTFQVPCQSGIGVPKTCTMMVFKLVIPIHVNVASPKCEFIPLNFFKVRQLMFKDSPYHAIFTRSVHREISPMVNSIPGDAQPSTQSRGRSWFRLGQGKSATVNVDADGNPIPTVLGRSRQDSNHSSSTLKLWEQSSTNGRSQSHDASMDDKHEDGIGQKPTASFGGIMISQEVTVHVGDVGNGPGSSHGGDEKSEPKQTGPGLLAARRSTDKSRKNGSVIEMRAMGSQAGVTAGAAAAGDVENMSEMMTFVDELFALCVDGR